MTSAGGTIRSYGWVIIQRRSSDAAPFGFTSLRSGQAPRNPEEIVGFALLHPGYYSTSKTFLARYTRGWYKEQAQVLSILLDNQ
jgi:hypothetical protein